MGLKVLSVQVPLESCLGVAGSCFTFTLHCVVRYSFLTEC